MYKWLFVPFIIAFWLFWLYGYLFPEVNQWQSAFGYVEGLSFSKKKNGKLDISLRFWYLNGKDTVYALELFEENTLADELRLAELKKNYPVGKQLAIEINPTHPLEATAFPELTREAKNSMIWGYVALFFSLIWLVWFFKANPKPFPKP